jgi:enoyl-CoA hydratase
MTIAQAPDDSSAGPSHADEHGDGGRIRVERHETVVTVTLDRPHKLNALTLAMWRDLGAVMRDLSADESVRAVIVRGAGERAFSPGNDIGEFHTHRSNSRQAYDYGRVMHATAAALDACPHPLIAQIHGLCVGGGLEIAALCDIRICATSSRFGAPIKNLGLVMAYPELAPLVRLVGADVTLQILLEGRVFDAAQAKDLGLVSRVVPDDQVQAAALESARLIAEGAPLVARWHKRFVRRLRDATPMTEAEYRECFDCFDTEDFRIGVQAFLAKTKPQFRGH